MMNAARSRKFGSSLLLLPLLASCGGGGSKPAPPPPPPTYTIGGSVAGLNGTLVLQQSGANNLNVTASGTFTFAGTVAANAAYAVTILTQPAGQACVVASGTGNANSNVTSVAVNCASLFTIGGTVSGLTAGSVTLQNNAGIDLTVSANGAFTFLTPIVSGSNYSVVVSAQPPGPDCAVTAGGSGTATANVTNVTVVCTADPAGFFLPFSAAQTNQPTQLHVVPSKAIARAPIQVATDWQSSLGYAMQLSRDGSGKLRADKPASVVYTAGNTTSGRHVYALDLSAASSLVPRQISTLTDTGRVGFICESWVAYSDLDDPTSAFMLFGMPTDPTFLCGGGNFELLRVRLSDGPTTAPAPLPNLPGGSKHFLYRPDGTLAGMVVCEYATNRLLMYHDDTFTTATTLLNGCINFMVWQPETVSTVANLPARPGFALMFVLMQDGTSKLYRVDHTRAISAMLHDQVSDPFDGTAIDDDYLYFSDRTQQAPVDQIFYRVRLDGTSTAQPVYTHTMQPGDTGLTLMGQVGSRLVLMRGLTIDPVTSARSGDVRTVNKTGSVNATVIASFNEAPLWVRVFDDLLFVNISRQLPGVFTFVTDTTVLTVDGTVVQPQLADSSFSGAVAGRMIQLRESTNGVTQTTRVEALDVLPNLTLSPTLLTRGNGSAYTLDGRMQGAFTFGMSGAVGAGAINGASLSYPIAIDIPRGTIETVTVPNKALNVVRDF